MKMMLPFPAVSPSPDVLNTSGNVIVIAGVLFAGFILSSLVCRIRYGRWPFSRKN